MKIKPEHYNYIQITLELFLEDYPDLVQKYEVGDFTRANKVKDLQRRFCFDVWYFAGLARFARKYLYSYMNDDHIYTALKSILPIVERKY